MTVYRRSPNAAFRYDFEFKGQRYSGSTHEKSDGAARRVEEALRRELRLEAAGMVPVRLLKGLTASSVVIDEAGEPRAIGTTEIEGCALEAERYRTLIAAMIERHGAPGWVYFLEDDDRAVKIGFTRSLAQRTRAIQTTSAKSVRLLLAIAGSPAIESHLHAWFGELRL